MLNLNNVSHRVGETLLFEHLTLTITRDDCIGIVGPNGAGKSSLLDVLAGVATSEGGTRTLVSSTHLGYLRQGTLDVEAGTLADALDPPTAGFFRKQSVRDSATEALSAGTSESTALIDRWQHADDAFDSAGGYAMLDRLEALFDRFGIPGAALRLPLSSLSGGERTRAGLAALLAMQPDVLLLDEPTNHLDMEGERWLSELIRGYSGAVVVVAHDRALLDDVATRILAFEPGSTEVQFHTGNYSDFTASRENQRTAELETYKRQQEKIAGLQASIDQDERGARKIEGETINFHYRKRAQKVARAATVRRARVERLLESDDLVDKPSPQWGLALDFPEPVTRSQDVVQLENVRVRRGQNLILNRVSFRLRFGERVALIGENGAGKTTLLHVLTGEITPESGYRLMAPGIRMGIVSQDQQGLDPGRTVLQTVQDSVARSESDLRSELHRFLFGGESVHRLVRDLSWGERSRLMLAMITIPGADVLLLDEPMNHLDIDARDAFEVALSAFAGSVVMVSHDRYATARVATRVLRIHDGTLVEVDTATDPEF